MTTTKELSVISKLSADSVRFRAKELDIPLRGGKYLFYKNEVNQIIDFKAKKPISIKNKYHKRKINIIDYYLSHSQNTAKEIAEQMGLSELIVNTTLNEWINEKTIIVESKINRNE